MMHVTREMATLVVFSFLLRFGSSFHQSKPPFLRPLSPQRTSNPLQAISIDSEPSEFAAIGQWEEVEGNFILRPSIEDGPPRALGTISFYLSCELAILYLKQLFLCSIVSFILIDYCSTFFGWGTGWRCSSCYLSILLGAIGRTGLPRGGNST